MVRWPGFEPGPAAWQGMNFNDLWVSHREQFSEWLSKRVKPKTAKDYLRALEKFFARYKIRDYESLQKALIREDYKRHLCKALRNFINYLKEIKIISAVQHEELKDIIILKKTGKREIYISDEELREAYAYFKKHTDEITLLFFELLFYSGARLSAVHKMLTTYDPRNVVVKGKIARYSIMQIEGTKESLFVYFPAGLVPKLRRITVNYDTIDKKLKYGRVSPSTIRKWFSNKLDDWGVSEHTINFIQSRIPETVLRKYYLELRRKADEAYSRVVEDLKRVLEVR